MEADYVLTVIEDAETPLAASAGGGQPYFSIMIMFMMLMVLLMAVLFYYMQCYKYRERFYSLCSAMGKPEKAGWNLKKLKEEVMEMENEQVSHILKEAW